MREFEIENLIFPDFASAASAVLTMLYDRLGFRLWMVTRTQGNDWIVLQVKDQGYGVKKGDVFRWTDSFCSRMVDGLGPRMAPCSKDIPAYAEAPIGNQVPIAAYVGVPLVRSDGSLFGTLCAIDPEEQSETICADQGFVELLAKLLSSLLDMEMKLAAKVREVEKAECRNLINPITKLYNAEAWDKFLKGEEHRCNLYGNPSGIIYIRLRNLEDRKINQELIRKTAEVITHTIRHKYDFIAHLSENTFAVLAVECDHAATRAMTMRLSQVFEEAQIEVFVSFSTRESSTTLEQTWKKAEANLGGG